MIPIRRISLGGGYRYLMESVAVGDGTLDSFGMTPTVHPEQPLPVDRAPPPLLGPDQQSTPTRPRTRSCAGV